MAERMIGIAGALSLALVAGTAHGAVIETGASLGSLATNWSRGLTFEKFTPGLGELVQVDLEIAGSVSTDYRIESRAAHATTHTMRLNGNLTLRRPDNTTLGGASVAHEQTDNLAAFDGTVDFGGPSGRTFAIAKTFGPSQITLTDAADLALFTGLDNITLPVSATMSSFFQGSSNVARVVQTISDASVRVKYTYIAIPGPGAVALAGMSMLVAARRKR